MHQLDEQPELEQLEQQQQHQQQHFRSYYQPEQQQQGQQSKDPYVGHIPAADDDDFPDDASIASSTVSMIIGPDGLPMKKPRRLRPIKNTKKLMRTLSEGFQNGADGLLRRTASGARLSLDRGGSVRASMESDVSGVEGSTPSMQKMKSLMHRLSFQGRRGSAEGFTQAL
jgi:hypothetical protein